VYQLQQQQQQQQQQEQLQQTQSTNLEASVPSDATKTVTNPDLELKTTKELRTNTIEWRFRWWRKIIDYTFHGPYFWTGKGYGMNLADEDGFFNWDHSLRSPHNGFMTILARSGVPGLLLWSAFLLTLTFQVARIWLTKKADQKQRFIAIWFLVCLAGFLFLASFDVFLEGPMAGIWFWSLVGFALAYFQTAKVQDRIQKETDPEPRRV
jgi:O-antigen ligase